MNSPDNEPPRLIGGPGCFICAAAPHGRLPTRPPYEPSELLIRLIRRGAQLRIQDAKRMVHTVRVSQLSGLSTDDEDEMTVAP